MSTSSKASKVSKSDLQALESLMAEMESSGPSETAKGKRMSRHISTAFPTLPSARDHSRSSSPSHLSARSSSALSVRSHTGSITPSLRGAEWASTSTPPSPRVPSSDATDYATPSTPPSSNYGHSWTESTSISTPPFSSRSAAFPSPTAASPGRLQPRSARNDRLPFEDLAFFREAMASAPGSDGEEEGLWPSEVSRNRSRTAPATSTMDGDVRDDRSIRSRTSNRSSLRSLRLRHEIEQVASQLRASSSYEDSLGLPREGRPPPRGDDDGRSLHSRTSTKSGSVGPPSASISTGHDPDDSETKSIASVKSSASGPPSVYGYSQPAPGGFSPSVGFPRKEARDRDGARPRQQELKEWSQSCWTWQREKSTQSSHGMLSKTPLIREVPAAMKRKMGKRDSSQLLSADINFDSESKGKPSKGSFGIGPTSSSKEGSWRKVTGVLRDDGYFRLFNEDTVILHSIHLPSVLRTDVRLVDPSLFGRPNCVVVHRRHGTPTPATPGLQTKSSRPSSSSSSSQGGTLRSLDEPVYICMPSTVATQSWLVMAHCFARPEFYTAAGGSLPQSPSHDHSKNRMDQSDGDDNFSDDDDEAGRGKATVADERCRIFRSVSISINEGRGIGELGTEVVRPSPKSSYERKFDSEGSSSTASYESLPLSMGGGTEMPSPGRSSASAVRVHRGDSAKDQSDGMDTFCEISIDGDALARTSVRKGTNCPFWNESFVFSDLPPITQPLTIKIFQSHKSSRPTLVGTSIVRVPDHPRAEQVEDWWPVKPATYDVRGKASDTVGELSLSVKVDEEVVLPSSEYVALLDLLNDDADAELASGIAHEFPADLEEVAKILLRVYQAESQLLPRILRLAEQEIDGDLKSASILFRGNSILTKSVELYLRLVGAEYLELSIGETVRRLCAERVEIEIDPSKMKSGVREKDIVQNANTLREWTTEVWNRIYSAREKCPNEVRTIFAHIQRIVADKYVGDEHKKMRSTSVSAFIFLRFFVPAVLNPKLFAIVPNPPDPRAQRSLTLIAKTLQGLANFSTFGQKEPWMAPMNVFVQEHTSAFVDFIDNISTPSPSARFEWTSPLSSNYLAPYRLRNSLPPAVREGVPLLPHLLDLPRDLGLLASHMARAAYDRGGPPTREGRADGASTTSSRASRSTRLSEFSDRCVDVHEEAQRRGGGLVAALKVRSRPEPSPGVKLRPRAATARGGSGWSGFSALPPDTPPKRPESVEEIHIRAAPAPIPGSPPASVASRKSHRSFTIGGNASLHEFALPSPTDAVVNSAPPEAVAGAEDEGAMSASSTEPLDFEDASDELRPGSPFANSLVLESDYSFPPRTHANSSKPVKVEQETTTTVSQLPPPSSPASPASPTSTSSESPMSAFSIPFSASSTSMSHSASQGSTSTHHSGSSSVEGTTAHVVSAGRRPSTTGSMGLMQSLMGEDPFGNPRKKPGMFTRMARKNSTAG